MRHLAKQWHVKVLFFGNNVALFMAIKKLQIFASTQKDNMPSQKQKTARCESLRALLPYVEWDRFVTLAGSKSGLRVTSSYLS
jgi:hypothetical protein